jgi:macrolide transport system ATP-binding/permease protein
MLQDLRFGFRMLRRSPGFSILAVLCLTLGIGGNAAAFSWIEGILFRPYPAVAHQDRMLALGGTNRATPGFTDLSTPDFDDFQRNCTLFESFIVSRIMGTTLSNGDRAERASGSIVSPNYFDALGVRPILGRGFRPEEGIGRNAHPVTVISYQLWKDRFKGDPEIVGKTQFLNGLEHTIIGVTPEEFYGTFVGYYIQFWVPTSMQEKFDAGGYKLEDRGARWLEGFAIMKPGVAIEQAQEEISAVAARLENGYPATNRGYGVKVLPLWQTPFNKASEMLPTLEITFVVVFFVLLIACANVGNLLLVRSLGRRHEMTVRLALGSGRRRLVRQLLTEGLILSALAAACGLVLAYWLRHAMVLFFTVPGGIRLNLPGHFDWRVIVLSIGICLISTVLFALVPAVQTSKINLANALKSESGGVVGGRGRLRIRSGLVLVQVSLSFVLLAGAGLLIQSMRQIQGASPGFSTEGVLNTGVDLISAGYDLQRAKNFQNELIDRVQALPGVESAAYGRVTPFSYRNYSSALIAVDGYEAPPDRQPTVQYDEVGPGYLATMGIPLVSGREFIRGDDETAAPVAVVNEVMVAQFWRGADPVGRRLQVKDKWMQVVGVAKTANYSKIMEAPKPFFYVPLRQNFSVQVGLNIRTAQAAGTIAPALAREIHALDPDLAAVELITMREQVDRTTASQKIAVTLLTVFGVVALLLAAVGLYGVMSYSVSQSTRELGLRMALGASTSNLVRLVMSQGLALTAIGLVLGSAAALGLTRLIVYMLYKVSPRDPAVFAAAFVVMTIASLAACFVPAWRATRTDPARALRE